MIKLAPLILKPPLSISNDIVSAIIYNKCDNVDFEVVNFTFLHGDVPYSTS